MAMLFVGFGFLIVFMAKFAAAGLLICLVSSIKQIKNVSIYNFKNFFYLALYVK